MRPTYMWWRSIKLWQALTSNRVVMREAQVVIFLFKKRTKTPDIFGYLLGCLQMTNKLFFRGEKRELKETERGRWIVNCSVSKKLKRTNKNCSAYIHFFFNTNEVLLFFFFFFFLMKNRNKKIKQNKNRGGGARPARPFHKNSYSSMGPELMNWWVGWGRLTPRRLQCPGPHTPLQRPGPAQSYPGPTVVGTGSSEWAPWSPHVWSSSAAEGTSPINSLGDGSLARGSSRKAGKEIMIK